MPLAPDRSMKTPGRAMPTRPGRDMSRPLPAALSWTVLFAFIGAFAIAYVTFALPWWLPAIYAGMSVVTFAAYGIDKASARRNSRRISEDTLGMLGLIAGWPGALIAQQLFRHKTRKRSFRRAFWGSVVVNIAALTAVIALFFR